MPPSVAGTKVATPAPPVPKSGDVSKVGRALAAKGPAAKDPRFAALLAQVQRNAKKQKTHPSAAQKAAEAQGAAKPPANEKTAGAKANSVDAMQEAKAEKPKTNGFLEMLRAEIEKVMPKTLDDTQHFMEGGEKDGVKNAVKGGVDESKSEATGPTEAASAAPPDTGAVPTRSPSEAPADPAQPVEALNAQNAVPVPKTAKAISQEKKSQDADAQMKEAEVTDTQLKKANDPRFTAVAGAKSDVKAAVKAAPGQYRQGEKAALAAGVAGATAVGRGAMGAMVQGRGRGGAQVKTRQQLAKERDEKRRKAVTDKIESIFTRTKTKVDELLASLETDVMAAFDAGMNLALAEMKSWSDQKIDEYKDDRYSGITGKAAWVADLFRDCPEGIKAILRQAKTRFSGNMDTLAVKISAMVDARLAAAKAEITKGQAEVSAYVSSLPADLKGVGKSAQEEVNGRFQELEDGIESKKQELASSLAQKFKEANDKADEELKKIESANAGALKKFADKLGEIIKIIAEFKGKLMAALRKGWETIKLILADPIGFLGNLISAVKGGISAFVANFGKHLLNGLAKWLFGNLASAGITMPTDLSLMSIFKLVMQVLGLTYANIRARAVKLVGEPVVKAVETMAEFIQIFIKGGPAALWAHIKEQLSDLKGMVIDAIIGWVTNTIITQATTKIISMFNPAGAFVQACIAIYNIVMFVIERAQQILAFIEAVVNSVHAIATGSIGGAITWIENALASTIPLVISFFARLIGLGGITAKIVSIIQAVQAKINKGIDWVLGKIIGGLKKLIAKVGPKPGQPDPRTPEEKKRDLDKAAAAIRPKANDAMRGGLMRAVLKARLFVWKREYKLTELDVKVVGGVPKIIAKINPEVEILSGVKIDDQELLNIVKDAAKEFQLKDKALQAKKKKLGITFKRGSAALGDTPRFSNLKDADEHFLLPHAMAAANRKGKWYGIRTGADDSTRTVVRGTLALNVGERKPRSYAEWMSGMAAAGATPGQIGASAQALPGGQATTIPAAAGADFSSFYAAQFGSEIQRNPTNRVYNVMHAQMMGAQIGQPGGGNVTADNNFFLQNNPSAMPGFVAASKVLNANDGDKARASELSRQEKLAKRDGVEFDRDASAAQLDKDVEEVRRRQVETALQWLRNEIAAGRLELTNDPAKLRQFIVKRVKDFYRRS